MLTILRDNREQRPWSFEAYPVEVEDATLKTGDYTVPELCEYDERLDTYIPGFAVERKGPSDFLSSITRNRPRFQKEIKRAAEWVNPLRVNVEAPWNQFTYRFSEALRYRNIHPNQIEGTAGTWEEHHDVAFVFHPSREAAERDALDTLMTAYRGCNTTSDSDYGKSPDTQLT